MMQLCHQSNSGAWITKGWLCMMMYHVVSCQKKDNTTSTTIGLVENKDIEE